MYLSRIVSFRYKASPGVNTREMSGIETGDTVVHHSDDDDENGERKNTRSMVMRKEKEMTRCNQYGNLEKPHSGALSGSQGKAGGSEHLPLFFPLYRCTMSFLH